MLDEHNTAVAKAQSILGRRKTDSVTCDQAIEIMKHVSECFNDCPSALKREIRHIVHAENKKMQALSQKMMPAAASPPSISKKCIVKQEGTSSKKGKLDGRLTHLAEPLTSKILYLRNLINPASAGEAITILQKRMENVLKEFEENQKNTQIDPQDFAIIRGHVRTTIEHYIQEIKHNEMAFNLVAPSKFLYEWLDLPPLIEWTKIHTSAIQNDDFKELSDIFTAQINSGIDFFSYAQPLLQGMERLPAELHKILITLTENISAEKRPKIEHIQRYDYSLFKETFFQDKDISSQLFEENKAVLEQFIHDMRVQQHKVQENTTAFIEELQQKMPNIDCKRVLRRNAVNPLIVKKFLEKIDVSTLDESLFSNICVQATFAASLHIHPTQEEITQYISDINAIKNELKTTYMIPGNNISEILDTAGFLLDGSSSKILDSLLSLKENKILLQYGETEWGILLSIISSGGTIKLFDNLRCILSRDEIFNFCFSNKELIGKLNTLSKDELTLVAYLPEFRSDLCLNLKEVINSILSNKEKSNLYLSVLKKCPDFEFQQIYPHIERVFECMHTPNLSVNAAHEAAYTLVKPFLSEKERFAVASVLPSFRDTVAYFYAAESAGELGNIASSMPLSNIPIDPLSRLIASRPFPEIKAWLEEPIPHTNTKRVETLTLEQRNTILTRFPRYESNLPTQDWMEFFHVTEEEARAICSLPECTIESPELRLAFEQTNNSMKDIDSNDPHSLLDWEEPLSLSLDSFSQVVRLLCSARKESICGAREVLTWGNGTFSSLCSSGNSIPLHARIEGNPVTLYQRNMFGDFEFPVYAATLQRGLINLINSDVSLVTSPSFKIEEYGELGAELQRMTDYFSKTHLQEPSGFKNFPPSVLDPMGPEGRLEKLHETICKHSGKHSFLPILRETYGSILSEFCNLHPEKGYDRNNQSHRLALTFASVLFLLRTANATFSENVVDIDLAENCSYHLKFLPGKCEAFIEDNPCVRDIDKEVEKQKFEDFLSDYSTHTLSPLTPNRSFSPQMCVNVMKEIQALDTSTFYALCSSCFALISNQADEYAEGPQVFEEWQKLWPEGVSLSQTTKTFLLQLVKQYAVSVDFYSPPLIPGMKITFDPKGVNTYVPESLVPRFIHSEGNYASALCSSFTIHDTILHDGNCGINAFFSALNGPQEYSGPDGKDKIRKCITQFRKAVVDYAVQHKDDFPKEYDINRTIRLYNDPTQSEWTENTEWLCAAEVYGREIRIYSRTRGDFTIDADYRVAPAAVFRPTGEPQGPPINILHYGDVHYCALIPK